jgi:tyrosyl-tRNA synthetase
VCFSGGVFVDFAKEAGKLGQNTVEVVTSEELGKKLERSARNKKPLRIKYGADPSAADIHLGHTVPLGKLKQFQDMGHEVIFLIGDFTAMIGDPSGVNKTRPVLTEAEVMRNAETYQEQVFKILDREKTKVVFNSSWCGGLKAADFIKLASCYTVARMLERDDFSARYSRNDSIGLHEFFYPLIQAFDSVYLEADVELGGTDQRFNLLLAREIQKHYGQEPQVVILMPLLEGTDGEKKMSKSLGNYVGVSDQPSDMYGKIMSIPDKILSRYYSLLLSEELPSGSDPYKAKKELAFKITAIYHGKESAKRAACDFRKIFSEGQTPGEMPEKYVLKSILREGGMRAADLISEAGLADTKNEARRLIKGGGARVDDRVVKNEDENIVIADGMVLRAGKRRFVRIRIKEDE